jgi:hypothetical protein
MMKKLYALIIGFIFCLPGYQFAQTVTINENPTGTSPNIVFGTLAFHASEYIYKDAEIGAANFTTLPISSIGFNVAQVGAPSTFNGVNIYMQNSATAVFATGVYSTAGYTLVYSGSVTMGDIDFNTITLQTPFLRTAGSNLRILIERTDGVAHTGFVFVPSLDDPTGAAATTVSRRFNGATAPVSGTTSLTASTFRAAIQLTATLPIDAAFTDASFPNASCHSDPKNVTIEVTNNGSNPILPGAASVTLNITGTNSFSSTLANTIQLDPGFSETLNFTGINLSAVGNSDLEAFVTLAGDGDATNDSLFTTLITANNISTFPAVENVEGALPVVSLASTIEGGQIWSIQTGKFGNPDPATVPGSWQVGDSLAPHGGDNFFIFNSFDFGPGISSRLFSNCLSLGTPPSGGSCTSALSFWMSHDTSFAAFDDSIYISVSTDKGLTWNRQAGFGRFNSEFLDPAWSQEFVDLSAFNGQTIQIGFEGVSNFGNSIGLDDIEIFSDCVLPVTLSNFTIQKQNKANKLNWKTTQELNAQKFVIEQSRNGRNFVTLGEVAATGNSSVERTYSYTHNLPSTGYNYYRIKMVDRDNKYKYSEVRSVQNLGVNQIQVTPNPVADKMKVSINAETADVATVTIADMSGKVIVNRNYNVTAGDNDIPVNTAALNAGSYIVKVQLNGDVQVSKFIKL